MKTLGYVLERKGKKKGREKERKGARKACQTTNNWKGKISFLKKSKITILLYAYIKDFLDIYEIPIISFLETNHAVNPLYWA